MKTIIKRIKFELKMLPILFYYPNVIRFITLILALIVSLFFSCGCTENPTAKSQLVRIPTLIGQQSLTQITVEGCEYFVFLVHGGHVLTHKGNCQNPIHKLPNDLKYYKIDTVTYVITKEPQL